MSDWYIYCDKSDCKAEIAGPYKDLNRLAREAGWVKIRRKSQRLDLCPLHAPYEPSRIRRKR